MKLLGEYFADYFFLIYAVRFFYDYFAYKIFITYFIVENGNCFATFFILSVRKIRTMDTFKRNLMTH